MSSTSILPSSQTSTGPNSVGPAASPLGVNDIPLFECDLSPPPSQGEVREDTPHLDELILYASLDSVDDLIWQTTNMYLYQVDRFNDFTVSAYVTPSHLKLLLLHRIPIGSTTPKFLDEHISKFFSDVHTLYTKILLNPFYQANTLLSCPYFEVKVRELAQKSRNTRKTVCLVHKIPEESAEENFSCLKMFWTFPFCFEHSLPCTSCRITKANPDTFSQASTSQPVCCFGKENIRRTQYSSNVSRHRPIPSLLIYESRDNDDSHIGNNYSKKENSCRPAYKNHLRYEFQTSEQPFHLPSPKTENLEGVQDQICDEAQHQTITQEVDPRFQPETKDATFCINGICIVIHQNVPYIMQKMTPETWLNNPSHQSAFAFGEGNPAFKNCFIAYTREAPSTHLFVLDYAFHMNECIPISLSLKDSKMVE